MTQPATPPADRLTPRERVQRAVRHQAPDRVPTDFLATPEVWDRLIAHLRPDAAPVGDSDFFDPAREALLRQLEIDCRVLSYDMFCAPPETVLRPGAVVEQWDVLSRSTPNRMWRQRLADGSMLDIFGRHTHVAEHQTGGYEEAASWPLDSAQSVEDLRSFPWPEPDWWDFSPIPGILAQLDRDGPFHIRFRVGSVFEVAWQLRGMQTMLTDLALDPAIPHYIMERLTDLYVELIHRVAAVAGDRLDMMYFYDDVATQKSLMVSKRMWREHIRPCHARIVEAARQHGYPVMYHSDGAMYPLLNELIELGVDVLNPIQADAEGMDPVRLKAEFGDRLAFHGGIDIIQTLPRGSVDDVRREVRERIDVLGRGGGYILASSHHIQSDTPTENVLAMYELDLRQPPES